MGEALVRPGHGEGGLGGAVAGHEEEGGGTAIFGGGRWRWGAQGRRRGVAKVLAGAQELW